jgi:hypothetical protein
MERLHGRIVRAKEADVLVTQLAGGRTERVGSESEKKAEGEEGESKVDGEKEVKISGNGEKEGETEQKTGKEEGEKEMKEVDREEEEEEEDQVSTEEILSQLFNFLKLRDAPGAEKKLLVLLRSGHVPDISIFEQVIGLYEGCGDFGKAGEISEQIFACRLTPSENLFCRMIHVYLRIPDTEKKSMEILERMIHAGFSPDQEILFKLLRAHCKKGLFETSESFYRRLLEFPKFSEFPEICVEMIEMYFRLRKFELAALVAEQARRKKIPLGPGVLDLMLEIFARVKNLKEIKACLKLLKRLGAVPKKETCQLVIEALSNMNNEVVHSQKFYEKFGDFVKVDENE